VVLDSRPILDEAFGLMAGTVVRGSEPAETLNELANRLRELKSSRGKFQWNPYRNLSTEVKRLYGRIVSTARPLSDEDHSGEYRSKGRLLCEMVERLGSELDRAPLQPSSRFVKYREEARAGRIDRLLELQFPDSPALKGKSAQIEFRKFSEATGSLCGEIGALRSELMVLHAREYFQPYIKTHRLLQHAIDDVRRRRGEVDLGDLILKLAQFIEAGNVPDLYFSIGERIYHYLIDEFQDTSPIQWKTLRPLIDNSLSEGGSLFVVGDTKQSIYGFRGADWRIMNALAAQREFASAPTEVHPLPVNYRSAGRILEFVRNVFQRNVPLRVLDGAERISGLSTFRQEARKEAKDAGYVECTVITGETDERPEKDLILNTVAQCLRRGFVCRDIAILTPENEDVVKVSGWLNEAGHEFIPFSTLDIRTRKVVGEILMFLKFLDSPLDDLAFASFVLGDIVRARVERDGVGAEEHVREFILEHHRAGTRRPLYAVFKDRFPDFWKRYIEQLFNLTGYLPLYDLITHVYKSFDVFSLVPAE
ncbi:MAG TPA: UvrD-helicase domain-containing protein, partial [Bacteroidota bacterium]